MNLILVESPTKARTLTKFLGKDYRIEATFGHLRDLPKGELGVDVEHEFVPRYVIPRDKAKRVRELKALVSKTDKVILATDPDREGEAIAWHLTQIFKSSKSTTGTKSIKGRDKKTSYTSDTFDTFQRITFHEITQEAIEEALKSPGTLNLKLVDAQQTRRILDRLVGYKLSPLIQKKLARRWLSAGRVQSIAVRLIVEREREIQKFNKEEYWIIESEFISSHPELVLRYTQDPELVEWVSGSLPQNAETPHLARNDKLIRARLFSKDGVKYEQSQTVKLFDGSYTFSKTSIPDKETADKIITDLLPPFTVSAVDKKEIKRSPPPPYTTASLQIDAGRRLGYGAKWIMQLAQNLYEDGFITYHRTDSVNMATKFLGTAKYFIEKTYGREYSQYRTYATKSKLAQEAHEAIRPTDVTVRSSQFRPKDDQPLAGVGRNNLGPEHEKLYELIWKRAVASQMAQAVFDSTTIAIISANSYRFETQGSVIKFDGYLKVTGYESEDVVLPDIKQGETVNLNRVIPEQKSTNPPPRYTEASLIKALEEDGIGRPSTYAPTLVTIQERLYVEKETKDDGKKGRVFIPTELGYLVNDFLVRYFPDIVDLQFTAIVEKDLDEIAQGIRSWQPLIAEFWEPFRDKLMHVEETVEKLEKPEVKTGQTCPKCSNGDVVVKESKYGKFLGCNRYPECDWRGNYEEKIGVSCPNCKEGDIIVRKTRKGRIFYGCSRYPDCIYASWTKLKVVGVKEEKIQ